MEVYAVLEINDYEYGCRKIAAICSTHQRAERYIEEKGNITVDFWNGTSEPMYIIKRYEIIE